MPERAQAASVVVIEAPTDGTDATKIIREQIAAAPNGLPGDPTIVRFPIGRSVGRYRVDGQVVISGREHLVIEGPSASEPALIWTDRTGKDVGIVARNGSSIRSHWLVTDRSSDILLRNVAVLGPNSGRFEGDANYVDGLVFEHGFSVVGAAQGVHIENCAAQNVHGDGAYVGGGSSNVRISSTRLTFCGRQGIAITDADGVLIDDCQLSGVRRSGIDLEPNGADWSISNVEVRNCSIDARLVAFVAAGHSDVSDVWIHHNVVQRSADSWPMLSVVRSEGGRARNWTFEDNVRATTTNPFFMVSLTRVDNIAIRRNTAIARGERAKTIAGVELTDCAGTIEIVDNDFTWSPELFIQKTSTPAVSHHGNKWGPNGSVTEGQPFEGPPPDSPSTTAQPPESAALPETNSESPPTSSASTTTSPDSNSESPPTSSASSTTTASPPLDAALAAPNPEATLRKALPPFDGSMEVPPTSAGTEDDETNGLLAAIQSIATPVRLVTTGFLAGLGALVAFVIKDRSSEEGRSSQPTTANSPTPEKTGPLGIDSSQDRVPPIHEHRPTTVDSRKRPPLQPAVPNSAPPVGRTRVEQDAWRFAIEYQAMRKDEPGNAGPDGDDGSSVDEPVPE